MSLLAFYMLNNYIFLLHFYPILLQSEGLFTDYSIDTTYIRFCIHVYYKDT